MPTPTEKKRIFLVTAILVVLLVAIFLLRMQKKQELLSQNGQRSASQEAQKMKILPSPTPENLVGIYTVVTSEKTLMVGGNFTATVSFEALGRQLDGTDVILRFDPEYLTANSTLSLGDYFSLYPRKEVDNEAGFIKVTAIQPKSSEVNTVLTPLFNASFKTKKTGVTNLSFEFQKGFTNMTTLVEKGSSKNLLGSIENASVTIEP